MVTLRALVDANSAVFTKLLLYSVAMVVLPLLTFFALDRAFDGHKDKTLWSGLAAASVAYLVCLGYCAAAFYEDTGAPAEGATARKRPKAD
jgi:hypothetical protein